MPSLLPLRASAATPAAADGSAAEAEPPAPVAFNYSRNYERRAAAGAAVGGGAAARAHRAPAGARRGRRGGRRRPRCCGGGGGGGGGAEEPPTPPPVPPPAVPLAPLQLADVAAGVVPSAPAAAPPVSPRSLPRRPLPSTPLATSGSSPASSVGAAGAAAVVAQRRAEARASTPRWPRRPEIITAGEAASLLDALSAPDADEGGGGAMRLPERSGQAPAAAAERTAARRSPPRSRARLPQGEPSASLTRI